jgi:protein gp37
MPNLTPTKIPYLTHVWNPVTGCSPAGEGCRNCYAARLAATRLREHPRYQGLACEASVFDCRRTYQWTGEVRFHADLLDAPLRARKQRVIGVTFMGDLWHEAFTDAQRDEVYARIALAPRHTFVDLTKRTAARERYLNDPATQGRIISVAERIAHDVTCHIETAWPLPNLWQLSTVCNQEFADRNITHLLATPAACRVVSLEPMLGPVTFTRQMKHDEASWLTFKDEPRRPHLIDGVFLGGESGPDARPMNPEWALQVYRDCKTAGVPFWFKQWGDFVKRHPRALELLPPGAWDEAIEMEGVHELPEAMQHD